MCGLKLGFTPVWMAALGSPFACVAIAMLCFDSTVGFPWSVPVLKQQLTAGGVFFTGTGVAESAGQEDPVELYFSSALWSGT